MSDEPKSWDGPDGVISRAINKSRKREAIESLEREAAALWEAEHPGMSVFNCTRKMKNEYRHIVADRWIAILDKGDLADV